MNDLIISPFEFRPEAVVIDNGEYPLHELPLQWVANAPYIICCDGAADNFLSKGGHPDIVIGDGDSLSATSEWKSSTKYIHITEQETNDQTKAISYLMAQGKKNIAIVGGTGKREDHTLGNISLLIEYLRKGIYVMMATDYGVFVPCHNETTFKSRKGQQISIINFSSTHFHSEGLVYPLPNKLEIWWQGTLNESATDTFSIRADGDYLVFLNYFV